MEPKPIEQLEPIVPFPKCPHCGKPNTMDKETYRGQEGVTTCEFCQGRFTFSFTGLNEPGLSPFDMRPLENIPVHLIGTPEPIGDPALLAGLREMEVPRAILTDYRQGVECFTINAFRATAVVCRYVLQEAFGESGVPDLPMEKMLNIAHERGLVSDIAFKQAAVIVAMGNKAAHATDHWTEKIGREEAYQSLLLCRRVLLELFVKKATS